MAANLFEGMRRLVAGRLQNRLVFVFSCIALFLVLIPSSLFYRQSSRIVEDNYVSGNKELLDLLNLNLDKYLDQIGDLSLSPRKDEQFMNALYSEDYVTNTYIQRQIRNLYYSRDDIDEISIYLPANRRVYTVSRKLVNISQTQDERIPEESWYREALHSKKFRSMEPVDVRERRAYPDAFLIYHRIIINIADQRPLAAITITFNTNEFNRMMKGIAGHEGESIGIFDTANRAFYLQGPEWEDVRPQELLTAADTSAGESKYVIRGKGKDKLLVLFSQSPESNWRLAKLIPMSVLNEGVVKARIYDAWVSGGLFLLAILVVLFVSKAITRRLETLSSHMFHMREDNMNTPADIKGIDEIANLTRKFNQLMVRIGELIEERYKSRINERNARLKALEAQINPHFLYNALQAISTRAITGGDEPLAEMVDALAATLRYGIKEAEQVTLRDELEHVHNYLVLQKARFGARLNVYSRIEEDLLTVHVPKMSLQILVENAVKHGLEQVSAPVAISIEAARSGSFIILRVRDNGPGIDAERLARIRELLQSGDLGGTDNIGLKNISSRIRLLFGKDAELVLRSPEGEGTEAEIRLPIREGLADDQSADY